jgi:hypothetical protein
VATSGAATPGVVAGINVEPAMRPWRYVGANPDGWWCSAGMCDGVPDGTSFVDQEMPLVEGLGVRLIRIEFPWFLLEPRQGDFDWGRADYIVNAAKSHHVELQPILVYSPAWAAPEPSRPPSAAAFGSFVQAAAKRYAGTIKYWEIWNEPNLGKYWNASAALYVSDLLVPAHQAIQAANPSAKVILGGPAGPDMSWLNAVYTAGGGGSFDILAFHDYGDAKTIIGDATTLHDLLQGHGQAGKPVWLGEFGIQQGEVHDTGQQALLASVFGAGVPINTAEWYNLRDDYSMTCCPPQVAVSGYWGLVKHDERTLKDGYATLERIAAGGRT